jgi:hypothetical protein
MLTLAKEKKFYNNDVRRKDFWVWNDVTERGELAGYVNEGGGLTFVLVSCHHFFGAKNIRSCDLKIQVTVLLLSSSALTIDTMAFSLSVQFSSTINFCLGQLSSSFLAPKTVDLLFNFVMLFTFVMISCRLYFWREKYSIF